jgi:hypothetical protein
MLMSGSLLMPGVLLTFSGFDQVSPALLETE